MKEFRIHRRSLQPSAIDVVLRRARRAANGKMCRHARENAYKRNVNAEDIRRAVLKGDLIEYHVIEDRERALIRDEFGVSVVVDLNNSAIITAWRNNPTDNHATLGTEYLFQ